MYDQAYITPILAMSLAYHAHMFDYRIRTALGYQVHGLGQIDQTLDRAHCDTVVHWNDNDLTGFPECSV